MFKGLFKNSPKKDLNQLHLVGVLSNLNRGRKNTSHFTLSTTKELRDGKRPIHHHVVMGPMLSAELFESLLPGVRVDVKGELFYGKDNVYCLASEVEVVK